MANSNLPDTTIDQLVEELEHLSLTEIDRANISQLLDTVGKLSNLVVDLGCLVFDFESKQRLESAFNALTATMTEARAAIGAGSL